MAGIFISYRRDESSAQARAVWERLCRELGREHVFMDVDGIEPGEDFVEHIEQQLSGCVLMLVLIGSRWYSGTDRLGRPRLTLPNDFVRLEVLTALSRKIKVVPVLIDDTPMPLADQLPAELHGLLRRQAMELDFRRHTEAALQRLVGVARKSLAPTTPAAPVAATVPRAPAPPSEPWMDAEGRDTHGRWADLRINQVIQRLRWIEPGEFWMGSTEAERKRFVAQLKDDQRTLFDDEKPRHQVKLTQGFWLADTACTQALWQTLLGDNPSHFMGDLNLPVEQVSWDDVTEKFLPALNQRLQGAQALLPTEAQWEYACRAGAETAYSFGELITPYQVNYDGNHAPPRGLYREGTVAVKDLPPNDWGLYQMHGNVLEWCADARRSYGAKMVRDPDGGQEGSFRALRGGSWRYEARWARCAFRFVNPRDYRSLYYGFRFALRSIMQAGGAR